MYRNLLQHRFDLGRRLVACPSTGPFSAWPYSIPGRALAKVRMSSEFVASTTNLFPARCSDPQTRTARMDELTPRRAVSLLVTLCIRVYHRGSMRGSGYGHIADSVRAERYSPGWLIARQQ